MEGDKTYYRKLIRDNVPANMQAKGVAFEARTLQPEEFREALLKKVGEEASGLENAKDRSELIAELADLIAVLDEVKKLESISEEELEAAVLGNLEKKGGFKDRVYLEWSSNSDNYKTNEKNG